jgi:hypothetical protein
VDTTASHTLDFTAQFGTASGSDTIGCDQLVVGKVDG